MSTETNGNERKNGCAAGYPVGLLAAVWCGSGEERPQGYAWQLDGGGGMRGNLMAAGVCVSRGRDA